MITNVLRYDSPLGGILLAADETGLTGLWFDGEKHFADNLPAEYAEAKTPILSEAVRWLDIYFGGKEPGFTPPLHPIGSPFRKAVENTFADSLRQNRHLRRRFKDGRGKYRRSKNVRASGGRSRRA